MPEASEGRLLITWVKSDIGYAQNQKRTIKALGLRRLGDKIVQPNNPAVRGMVATVSHLVEVEEVTE